MDDFINPNSMDFNDNNEILNLNSNISFIDENEIHIYKQKRGGRKYDTIIQGLKLSSDEETNKTESKKFISFIKKKFGKGGCQKMLEDFDKDEPVFIFQGDIQDKITEIIITNYGKPESNIILHGE
jgi:translation initiation factor 1 (eIF-1/SUI1)